MKMKILKVIKSLLLKLNKKRNNNKKICKNKIRLTIQAKKEK